MLPPSPGRHPSLSIIVPLYNEEENLSPLVAAIFEVLAPDPDFLELVLVDDGSHDQSAKLAINWAGREPRIRLLRHERNRGLGAAIRTGLAAAEGDWILYTDADLPFDFRLIPQLLTLAAPDQVVIGCRANRGEGPRRWLLSQGYNLLFRALFGLRVRDVNFACKLIPRRALHGMRLTSEGSFIDAELLLESKRQGLRITEFPLIYYPRRRGQSTLSRPAVIFGMLTEMVQYLWRPAYLTSWKRQQLSRSPLHRYGWGVLAFALSLLLTVLLQPVIGASLFLIFLPAVIVIAWYHGLGPGLMVTGLAAFFSAYLLMPPVYSLSISQVSDLWRLSAFVVVASSINVLANSPKWIEYVRSKAHGFTEEIDQQRG